MLEALTDRMEELQEELNEYITVQEEFTCPAADCSECFTDCCVIEYTNEMIEAIQQQIGRTAGQIEELTGKEYTPWLH